MRTEFNPCYTVSPSYSISWDDVKCESFFFLALQKSKATHQHKFMFLQAMKQMKFAFLLYLPPKLGELRTQVKIDAGFQVIRQNEWKFVCRTSLNVKRSKG